MIEDYFGQELQLGDVVILGTTMDQGRGFNIGTISKFNPKTIIVDDALKKSMRWVYDKTLEAKGSWDLNYPKQYTVKSHQLLKVDPELLTLALLKGKYK